MDEFPTFKARDLDLGSGHTAYRHASLINHDLHAKFHWSRRAVDLTSSILHCKLSERQSSNLLRRAIKPCILTIQKTEKVKTVGNFPAGIPEVIVGARLPIPAELMRTVTAVGDEMSLSWGEQHLHKQATVCQRACQVVLVEELFQLNT